MNPDDDINSNDVNQVNDPDLPETSNDEPESKGTGMQAAGTSNRRSNRSGAHGGRNASGAVVDKDAQRRGGQHSHGGR